MSSAPIKTVSSTVNEESSVPPPPPRREVSSGRKHYFFLTIPGIIRLLEIFLSGMHIGSFGYFGTFYNRSLDMTVVPFFLATTREAFFLLANFHTFVTIFTIMITVMISFRSHKALLCSLYMFIFDFIQCVMVLSGSVGLLLLYQEADAKIKFENTVQTRQGLAVTGMMLGCLHLLSSIYDLIIFVRRSESRIIEQ